MLFRSIRIASEGTRMLLGYMEQNIRPANVYLENKLIIRESVRPAAPAV